MWTGRWTSASPGIKEEKAGLAPAPDMAPAHTPALAQSPPHHTASPALAPATGYPAFPESIVFSGPPPTTSSDILYDSINMSHAYPALTSSIGEWPHPARPHQLQCL
jgi:hypothetical protein